MEITHRKIGQYSSKSTTVFLKKTAIQKKRTKVFTIPYHHIIFNVNVLYIIQIQFPCT